MGCAVKSKTLRTGRWIHVEQASVSPFFAGSSIKCPRRLPWDMITAATGFFSQVLPFFVFPFSLGFRRQV